MNWGRYIALLIPIRLRQRRLVELIKVLVGQLMVIVYNLSTQIEYLRLKKCTTWQTLWIQKIVEYELNVMCNITELNGLPFDFMVTTSVAVDEQRLAAIVNRYKLPGRSFTLSQADVVFSAKWADHVCELDGTVVYSAKWADNVCEQVLGG